LDTIALGKHNPRLADIRRAIDRGTLTPDGLLPVEGPNLVREALASGLRIEALFLREGTSAPELSKRLTTYTLSEAIFKGIQSTEHSQGILALVQPKSWSLKDVLSKPPTTIPVLAALQDPGNVGTILRVAESFGAAACLALQGTAAVHNPKVLRASAGSIFRLPHVWDLEWTAVVSGLKTAKIPLIGTSPHASESITSWDWKRPAAILIGNEGAGLSPDQIAACAVVLRIPQQPPVESLNSAIASAVVLYEAYRRRTLS